MAARRIVGAVWATCTLLLLSLYARTLWPISSWLLSWITLCILHTTGQSSIPVTSSSSQPLGEPMIKKGLVSYRRKIWYPCWRALNHHWETVTCVPIARSTHVFLNCAFPLRKTGWWSSTSCCWRWFLISSSSTVVVIRCERTFTSYTLPSVMIYWIVSFHWATIHAYSIARNVTSINNAPLLSSAVTARSTRVVCSLPPKSRQDVFKVYHM